MQSKGILLDTSLVIRHFREANSPLLAHRTSCDEIYLPQPALGELYAGAYRSKQPERNLDQIRRFLEAVGLLMMDETTPELYGRISAHLSRAGTPIPQNDIWIAALAVQFDLPVATADSHFKRVPDLKVLVW